MLDLEATHGLARLAKLSLEKGELELPLMLFIDGHGDYKDRDILLDAWGSAQGRKAALWSGNPVLQVEERPSGKDHLFSIPAHIPFPPSINREKGRHYLEHELSEEHKLFVLLNGPELAGDPKRMAKALRDVLDRARPQDLIYAPGLGLPGQIAVLVYLGVDILDSQAAVKAALMGQRLVAGSPGRIADMRPLNELLSRNYALLRSEMETVREALKAGELRNLAEERANGDIGMMALLRTFDDKYYELLERDLATGGKGKYRCISRESLNRPAVVRWRRRLDERYSKPDTSPVLLLLPCSARKPYSFSKTHRAFRNEMEGLDNIAAVHEVIVTSPLGLVPRELELYHPANSYDIPVIGVWDANEVEMIRSTLKEFLRKNKYDRCVVHFPELDIVKPVLDEFFDDVVFTCEDGRPASDVSLFSLRSALETVLEDIPRASKVDKKKAEMLNRTAFQFSPGFAKALPEFRVMGKYPYLKMVTGSDRQLGMLVEDRGGISLTLEGARILAGTGAYTVAIQDFKPKGTVFAVGILDATDDIRPGDEVVLVAEGEYRGTGTALMSGRQMRLLNRGKAVSVRHHI